MSGDGGGQVQNVGYPDFIQIQNSVRMPVARGRRSVGGSDLCTLSDDSLQFSLSAPGLGVRRRLSWG